MSLLLSLLYVIMPYYAYALVYPSLLCLMPLPYAFALCLFMFSCFMFLLFALPLPLSSFAFMSFPYSFARLFSIEIKLKHLLNH